MTSWPRLRVTLPGRWCSIGSRSPQTLVLDLETALAVLADFPDLKSPFFAGHARAVSALGAAADPGHAELLRRAGLLQDLGRVAVPSGVWARPEPLSAADFEAVRLHPYYAERILARAPVLSSLARVAGMHQEHLDDSGYHHRAVASEIPYPACVMAAADADLGTPRARGPHPCVGHRTPPRTGHRGQAGPGCRRGPPRRRPPAARSPFQPAGPTPVEVQVLRLLCTGATKKDVTAAVFISPSTADHHVRHIYGKLGVRSRAAATLYASERGLV